MQHNNLLKKAILALLLCVAMPCVNAQMAHIGDILCEGDLIVSPASYNANTHTAIGVVFYVDQTGQHGWAIALQDEGEFYWGPLNDTRLPNYSNMRQAIYDLDGYQNTQIVRAYSSSYTAFNVVDFENGWYLPAIGQLNYLYGNLLEINNGLALAGGTIFDFTVLGYWSSTEYSSDFAWILQMDGKLDYYVYRSAFKRHVRAARNF